MRSSSSTSHTNRIRLHSTFHDHKLLTQTPTCDTTTLLSLAIEYNLGNLTFKALLPSHLSSQNLIWFPCPSLHATLSSKLSPHSSEAQNFFRSFHQLDTLELLAAIRSSLQSSYLDSIISFHNPPSIDYNHQIHFPKSA